MATKISKRCACREDVPDGKGGTKKGKQLGAKCPKLKRKEHGKYGFRLSAGKDEDGKRRVISDFSYTDPEDAQEALEKVQRQLRRRTYSFERTTVKDYLNKWLARKEKRDELKASTLRMYRSYIDNDIAPALGALELRKVARADVTAFRHDLEEAGRGGTTIRRIHATLSSAFAEAVSDGVMAENVCNGARLPKAGKSDVQIWDLEDVKRFREAAAGHRLGPLFEVALHTGLRRGELLALRWSDVDLHKRILVVRTNLVQVGQRVVENSAKTEAGQNRSVPLGDEAVGALLEWKFRQDSERAEWDDAYEDSGRVFTYENGTQLRPGYPSSAMKTLIANNGLPPLKFHGLRHQFASNMIASGVPLAVVSQWLGHASINITLSLYGHMVPNTGHNYMNQGAMWMQMASENAPMH
ncbi:tyrosine-type recombinase/integrase [Brevibacterium aurantiacum]|uniref:tyrosine-type recombinase/integrase n=1 Tax=Brevibacterium aurantiacum TaxID=273384 RepID=UPI001866C755|nr:site-specific integrase [Brevibacterium aurantiacum]